MLQPAPWLKIQPLPLAGERPLVPLSITPSAPPSHEMSRPCEPKPEPLTVTSTLSWKDPPVADSPLLTGAAPAAVEDAATTNANALRNGLCIGLKLLRAGPTRMLPWVSGMGRICHQPSASSQHVRHAI